MRDSPMERVARALAWILAATPPDLAGDPAHVAFPRVRLPDGTWALGGPAREDAPGGGGPSVT